jgi:hypothetical protein
MKIRFLLLLLTVCTYFPIKAQMNLVPNPSFEDVVFCPNGLGQLYLASNWDNWGISPDLYCECAQTGVNVPYNIFNFQYANTGQCMAGLITFIRADSPNGPNAREYIGTQLIQPLTIGSKFYFSCFINFANSQNNNIATNNFGMLLLNSPIDSSLNFTLTNNYATIFTDSIITDTVSWYKIQGSFFADSAYSYIALGNFFKDFQTDTTSFGQFPFSYPYQSYYFLDDLCLSTDSMYCENWTSNHEIPDNASKLNLFPNPVVSTLNITSELVMKSITVKNVFGRQLLNYEGITETSTLLNLEEMPSGMYIIEIDLGESILNRKIIKL